MGKECLFVSSLLLAGLVLGLLLMFPGFCLAFEVFVLKETFCDFSDDRVLVFCSFAFFFCDEQVPGVLQSPFCFDLADPDVLVLGLIMAVRKLCLSSRGGS